MPHLSPIVWVFLFGVVWGFFVLLVLSFELINFSLLR